MYGLDRVFYTFLPVLRATRQLLDEERGNLLVGSPSIHMNFIWRYLGVYFISIGSAIFPLGRVTFMCVFVFFCVRLKLSDYSLFPKKKPQGFSIEAILIYSSNGVVQHHLVMTGFRFIDVWDGADDICLKNDCWLLHVVIVIYMYCV